jgi:hypothetical protein
MPVKLALPLIALLLTGCLSHRQLTPPMVESSNALTRAQLHGDSALEQMKLISVSGDNKIRVGFAISNLLAQQIDHAAIEKANRDEVRLVAEKDAQLTKVTGELQRLHDNRGVKAVLAIQHFWVWVKVIIASGALLAIVCALIGTFTTGPLGKVAWEIFQWIWTIATGGLGAVVRALTRVRIDRNFVPMVQHEKVLAAVAEGKPVSAEPLKVV